MIFYFLATAFRFALAVFFSISTKLTWGNHRNILSTAAFFIFVVPCALDKYWIYWSWWLWLEPETIFTFCDGTHSFCQEFSILFHLWYWRFSIFFFICYYFCASEIVGKLCCIECLVPMTCIYIYLRFYSGHGYSFDTHRRLCECMLFANKILKFCCLLLFFFILNKTMEGKLNGMKTSTFALAKEMLWLVWEERTRRRKKKKLENEEKTIFCCLVWAPPHTTPATAIQNLHRNGKQRTQRENEVFANAVLPFVAAVPLLLSLFHHRLC